jgi:signal transduction histidine kinase
MKLWVKLALLAGQTAATLVLSFLHAYFLMTSLLVVVGWQVALCLPSAIALGWIAVQSLAGGLLLTHSVPLPLLASSCGAVLGFQIFALATAELTRSERAARRALDHALQQLTEAQADLLRRERQGERLKIARDLHDELGHGLTALGMMAATAELSAADPSSRDKAAALKAEAGDPLRRVRSVVSQMREDESEPEGAKIDLGQALRSFCDNNHLPLAIDLVLKGDLSAVSKPVSVALLRLVQESSPNALRHAGSNVAIRIEVNCDEDLCQISVTDDGVGADRFSYGNGLSGMRERMPSLGGDLSIERTAGKGCHISARLPMRRP